jgi:hypothetical protein
MTRLALSLALAVAAWGQTPTTIDYTMLRGIMAAAQAKQPCVVVVSGNAMTCASFGPGVALVNNVLTVAVATLPAPMLFFGPAQVSPTTITTFTLTQAPVAASYLVWRNGLLIYTPGDYTITGNVLTLAAASGGVGPGDVFQVW